MIAIRPYAPADLKTLVALFTAAVHTLGAPHYGRQQLDAWAPRPPDLDTWRQRFEAQHTLVAEDALGPCGFVSWRDDGYIDTLYTAPRCARRGVATRLVQAAEDALSAAGVTELSTEASLAAWPFFETRGFEVVEPQTVTRRGASFTRFLMRKENAA
ncbi:GNAT family N-acetyltransferase [uncultured Azohydromonas sp.]|uniref:GNAT family N-acetyltransferase n=1 Tax=uncultured Azohydromonas sp. TaxID=487342 RepID=UPI002636744F|nr:GNAT family N-acetyltransferase [uncultured Azohydromonas sp.]